ncbi:hypothetical protein QCA50_008701 [Cerrena zonata]|uniref:MYND-type domain-containing protein n=1 Tax=Cerrena zonata TaxID=2478898 RepID=A0AAW0GE94_9APHY
MTTKDLSRQFMPLLKKFTTGEALSRVLTHTSYGTPLLFNNDKFNQYIQPPEAYRAELEPFTQLEHLRRAHCLTMTLLNIFTVFAGLPEVPIGTARRKWFRSSHLSEEERKASKVLKTLCEEFNPQSSNRGPNVSRIACRTWGCHKVQKEGEKKMMLCGPCKKKGLEFYYCSKECQIIDWKNGHKKLCGVGHHSTQGTNESDPSPTVYDYPKTGIPNPVLPFTHSPALLYQISSLLDPNEVPCDYILFNSKRAPCALLMALDPPEDRIRFHVMRRRAMSTGDQNAVYAMYKALRLWAAVSAMDIDEGLIRHQLREEYGVQINQGDESKALLASNPTKEEKESASKYIDKVLGWSSTLRTN